MKKLLYILMAGWIAYVMALGCKKEMKPTEEATTENARGKSTANFYHTCADSWNETASQGLAAEVDVLKLRLGGSKIKSWWIAFYYQVNGERRWVQWGYAVDKSGLFPAFFVYRFPNGQGYQFAPIINYSGKNVPLAYNTKVRFEIKNKPGTTFWSFSRNGQEVFEADMECTEATGAFQACTYPADKRTRVIITSTNFYGNVGGVAYINSLTWGDGTPCFVFPQLLSNNLKYIADASSHEASHTFGNRHQSDYENCIKTNEYSSGKIMGYPYYTNAVWWNGTSSACCTCIQDDKEIINNTVNL